MAWLPVFGMVNVGTDVDACERARGLCGYGKGVCKEVGSVRKIPCRTRDSNPPSILRRNITVLVAKPAYTYLIR